MSEKNEYAVYSAVLTALQNEGWMIVCASPPGGTDPRFRKCLFPRREIGGSDKGPRDEVDVTALKGNLLVLIECKPKLSQSLRSLNTLMESDYWKLKRIAQTFPAETLRELLVRSIGLAIPVPVTIALALAVGEMDDEHPSDISVFHCQDSCILYPAPPLEKI